MVFTFNIISVYYTIKFLANSMGRGKKMKKETLVGAQYDCLIEPFSLLTHLYVSERVRVSIFFFSVTVPTYVWPR